MCYYRNRVNMRILRVGYWIVTNIGFQYLTNRSIPLLDI